MTVPAVLVDNVRILPRSRGEARLWLLRVRGLTLSEIARREGKDLGLVSKVNAGRKRHRGLERAIARALRLSLRQAFPEWYGRAEHVA